MSVKLRFDDDEYDLPTMEDLTFREAQVCRREFGHDPMATSPFDADGLAAMAWVARHRVDPAFTPDQILDRPMISIDVVDDGTGEELAEGEASRREKPRGAGGKGGKAASKRGSATTRAASGAQP